MIAKAKELYDHLLSQGFTMKGCQEEDIEKGLDAEVEIHPNVVVQIGYGQQVEYGLTIEPHKQKRANSGFHHVGYFDRLDPLVAALRTVCPEIPQGTWQAIVVAVANERQEFDLKDIYKALEDHPRAKSLKDYKATIRRTIGTSKLFKSVSGGRYILVEQTTEIRIRQERQIHLGGMLSPA